jgi:hypothetical protein
VYLTPGTTKTVTEGSPACSIGLCPNPLIVASPHASRVQNDGTDRMGEHAKIGDLGLVE